MQQKDYRGQNVSGKKFGRLLVVSCYPIYQEDSKPPAWQCKCDCGNVTYVPTGRLTSGNTKSCGCIHKEQLVARVRKHGHKPQNGRVHPLYYRWYGMIQRCEHPNNRAYRWYGAKGIKVCKRWHDFQLFLDDMEKDFRANLTIERRDSNKDYCPSNCYWAPWSKQHETKGDHSKMLTLNGKTLPLKEWSKRTGIKRGTIHSRLAGGWSVEKTLTLPLDTTRKKK